MTPLGVGGSELARLLAEHAVVFFEPTDLNDDQQKTLLDEIGTPYIHPLAKVAGAEQATASHIVDDADHPPYQDQWHTDVTWDPILPRFGSLRAIEMPDVGGDTLWVDVRAAYESLPDELKQRIESLSAIHDMGAGKSFVSKAGQGLVDTTRAQYPGFERPMVGERPGRGERYLNVNSGFTREVVGVTPAESDELLTTLFAHIEGQPQLRHEWRVGEFVVWDEQATQHYAAADHFPRRREMSRYVVS